MHGQVVPYSASVPVPRCDVGGWVGVVVVVMVVMVGVVMMMMARFLLDGGLMGFSEKVLRTMIEFSRCQELPPGKRVFMTASPL